MSNVPDSILRAVKAAKTEIVKLEGKKGYDAILAGEYTPPEVMSISASRPSRILAARTSMVSPAMPRILGMPPYRCTWAAML